MLPTTKPMPTLSIVEELIGTHYTHRHEHERARSRV